MADSGAMAITARMYRDADDFRAMQALVSAAWLAERPVVSCTAGDLEWWMVNDPPLERSDLIRLWFEGTSGALLGWAFLEPPGNLDWHVRRDHRGGPVSAEMLDWLDERARSAPTIAGLAAAAPDRTATWAMDADEATRALLARNGYAASDKTLTHWVRTLPAGAGLPHPTRRPRCRAAIGCGRCAGRTISRRGSTSTGRHSLRPG